MSPQEEKNMIPNERQMWSHDLNECENSKEKKKVEKSNLFFNDRNADKEEYGWKKNIEMRIDGVDWKNWKDGQVDADRKGCFILGEELFAVEK